MSQLARSGGRVLVDGLVANGVKLVFCVPGESYLAALDAFYEHREHVQLIVCRQEGGAAYMAEAYGKLNGQPGVCFVSRGPGASNAMIGIHTAFQDSTPLLLFIGQIPRVERGREAFQELDYEKVYANVAKAVFRIEDAADIPRQLFTAWKTAISDRPGPVVIELPEDMLRDEVIVTDLEKPVRLPIVPPAEHIAHCGDLLAKAKRPIVIFGGAAWTPQANQSLVDFSVRHALPLVCAFRRQDMADNTHPHYIGELGVVPSPLLGELVKDSDLVIAIAARLGEVTSYGYTLFDIPEFDENGDRKLIHVFPEQSELNRVYQADLSICSDAATFLQAMQGLEPAVDRMDGRTERIKSARQSYVDWMKQPSDPGEPVKMEKIMDFLRGRLPADTIIANGAGNYTVWAQRNYQFRAPKTQLASTNGSMGYGVPAGIAGKLFRPNAIVVSFSGDGCFLMNGQELATAVQYGLNVIFIVINNCCYGTIRAHQERYYPDRPIGTSLRNPNFAELGRAYGAYGAVVTQTDEFEGVFEQALREERPAVIEIQTTR